MLIHIVMFLLLVAGALCQISYYCLILTTEPHLSVLGLKL